MDPVSIVGLVASAVQLADVALKIGKGLHEYRERYGQAGRTLKSIVMYCNAVNSSILMIKDWIENTVARSPTREQQIESLSTMIGEFLGMMVLLEVDIDNLLGKETSAGDLRFKTKAKFAWNEKIMKEHLEEINYLASALHLLLDATKLSVYDTQKLLESLADNATSINSTRCSLLSTSKDRKLDARFVFDDTLLSSHVYRKTHLSPPFLHPDDEPPTALSIAQGTGTLWFTADDSLSSDGAFLRRARSMDTLCQRNEIPERDPSGVSRSTQVQPGEEIVSGCTPTHAEAPASVSAESYLNNPWLTKNCLSIVSNNKLSGFAVLDFLTMLLTEIAAMEHLGQESPAVTSTRPLWHYFDYILGFGTSLPLAVFLGKLSLKPEDIKSAYREVVDVAVPPITAVKNYETRLLINQPRILSPGDENPDSMQWKEYKFYRNTETCYFDICKPWEELWTRSGDDLSKYRDLRPKSSGIFVEIARNGTSSIGGWRFQKSKNESLFDKRIGVPTRQELLKSEFNLFTLYEPLPLNKTRRARLRDSIAGALGLKTAPRPQSPLALGVQTKQDHYLFLVDGTTPNPKREFTYNFTNGYTTDGPTLPTLLKEKLVDTRRRREAYDPERWRKYVEAG